VQQFEHSLAVAKAQVQPAHLFLGDLIALVALHDEGGGRGKGDQVDAVGVAVEVFLEDCLGVKHAQVGSQTSRAFVLRSVHGHTLSGVGTGRD